MNKIIILTIFTILYGQDIAFVGNSITASGYDAIIDSILTEYTTQNFGVEGITVSIPNSDYKSTQAFLDVLALEPEYIIVLLGANDRSKFAQVSSGGRDSWETKYRYLITNFVRVSQTVFLGTLPYQIYSGQNSITDLMNKRILDIAQDYGIDIVNFNVALGTNTDNFLADGVHPSSVGKRIMAAEVLYKFDIKLGIDDEYWQTVIDYEEQKKVGWFGCQK